MQEYFLRIVTIGFARQLIAGNAFVCFFHLLPVQRVAFGSR